MSITNFILNIIFKPNISKSATIIIFKIFKDSLGFLHLFRPKNRPFFEIKKVASRSLSLKVNR